MKKLIQRLMLGTALMVAGAGVSMPFSYNAGKEAGYDSGRESTKKVNVQVEMRGADLSLPYRVFITDTEGREQKFKLEHYTDTQIDPLNQVPFAFAKYKQIKPQID